MSKAADHGGLWLAIACGMALSGRRGRRAAAQGLVALSLASVVTNVFLKPASRRTRPPAGLVPDTRVPLRAPVTTSFPSGHAASAAAFATAVLLEQPALGVALVPLSVVVAASRVVIGVHYPSDVIAGAVVGVVVGVAASAVPCGPGGSTSPPREAGR
ncbi:phosphatase PAP2 family protein [Kineosporia sp. A_224]|uniref:phosphatase PAP2 family protein n=1 Tax=Kineosporia sp. A_224 TaxID=1962180 RepID=UPI0013040ACF|nr:phosphatase PAP2 family protein [Kineosporia sp. A_224]